MGGRVDRVRVRVTELAKDDGRVLMHKNEFVLSNQYIRSFRYEALFTREFVFFIDPAPRIAGAGGEPIPSANFSRSLAFDTRK